MRTQIKNCIGERTRHRFIKGERCIVCGVPNPKLDPQRNSQRGRPQLRARA